MARAEIGNRDKVLFAILILALLVFSIGLRIIFGLCSAASLLFRGCFFPVVLIIFLILGVIAGSIFVIGQLFLWLIEAMVPPKTVIPST